MKSINILPPNPRDMRKQQLMDKMRAVQSMRKDKTGIYYKKVFFRLGVEYGAALVVLEGFTRTELKRFYKHIAKSKIPDMTDADRKRLKDNLLSKMEWAVWRDKITGKANNKTDKALRDMGEYNAQTGTDYMLTALTFLLEQKNIPPERLRVIAEAVISLDNQDANVIVKARQALYEEKGIWIELENDCPAEEGREVEVI